MTLDLLAHIAELVIAVPVAWKLIHVANRVLDVLKDFPPHRHDNGNIIYPKGYEPTAVQTLYRVDR